LRGPHPTFYPDLANESYLDAICVGEGEGAILDLVNALEAGQDITKIKNLIVKRDGEIFKNDLRPLISNLDAIPFPDRTIYEKYSFFRKRKIRHLITARGCPFKCSFCFNKLYNEMYHGKGEELRRRTPRNVIEEIKKLKQETPKLKHIFFLDDTFIITQSWLDQFVEIYRKEVNLPFSCNV